MYRSTTYSAMVALIAERYTRPRKEPQLGHAMCGNAG